MSTNSPISSRPSYSRPQPRRRSPNWSISRTQGVFETSWQGSKMAGAILLGLGVLSVVTLVQIYEGPDHWSKAQAIVPEAQARVVPFGPRLMLYPILMCGLGIGSFAGWRGCAIAALIIHFLRCVLALLLDPLTIVLNGVALLGLAYACLDTRRVRI